MEIRPFRNKDTNQLKKLYLLLYKDYQNTILPEELRKFEEYKDLEATIDYSINFDKNSPDWQTYVIDIGEKGLAGFITGTIKEFSYYKLDKFGMIENFYIREDYRHKGLGQKLLDSLELWFKLKDCKTIRTEAWFTNQKAIDFYEKTGFKKLNIILVKELC